MTTIIPPMSEEESELVAPKKARMGFLGALFKGALKRRDFKAGMAIVLFFIAVGGVSLVYLPFNPLDSVGPSFAAPNHIYWFGTTNIGQDVFSEWMYGVRATLLVGFLAAAVTAILGVTTGIAAGYFSSADGPLMRVADVILALPTLPLLIVAAAFLKPGDVTVAFLIAFLSWAGMSRTLRSSVLSLKSLPFIEVAVLSNVPAYKVMFVDLLKHTLPLILTYSLFAVGGAILSVASLDFLGVGPVTDYSWGSMISLSNDNNALLAGAWWWPLPPGLSIAILITGFALMAYGLESAFKKV
jgi:peptide/nickel transport system permease protein